LHTTTTDEHDRVLLEVVPLTRDVCGHLEPVGQPHTRNLPERRVRLLRSRRVHTRAHAPLLRIVAHRGGLALLLDGLAPLADQLVDRRHTGIGKYTKSSGWRSAPPASARFSATDRGN